MNIICSPQGIVDIKHSRQGIGDMAQAGFKQILLNLSSACPPSVLESVGNPCSQTGESEKAVFLCEYSEKLCDSMNQILEHCREKELQCTIAMAPYLDWNTRREDLNDLMKHLAEESLEICGQIGCRYLIVRPLSAGIPSESLWLQNREFYLHLAKRAKKYGVQILLENQCRDFNGHLIRGLCSDGRQASDWTDILDRKSVV